MLFGILRTAAGATEIPLDLPTGVSVKEAVLALIAKIGKLHFRHLLLDDELGDPRPSNLLFLNDTEISALGGLNARIAEDDVLKIVPVAHGGS